MSATDPGPGLAVDRCRQGIAVAYLWLRLLALLAALGLAAPVNADYDAAVERAQARLSELGYDPGPVDGLMGSRTREALRQFQRDAGIEVDGKLGPQTRGALGRATTSAPVPPPEPAPTTTPEPDSPPVPKPAPEAKSEPKPEPEPEAKSHSEAGPKSGAAVKPRPEPRPREKPGPEAKPVPAPKADAKPEPEPKPKPKPKPESSPKAADPRPARTSTRRPKRLTYASMGWIGPQSAAAILDRYRGAGASPIKGRSDGDLIVPDGDQIYILAAGERIPGVDCDPSAGTVGLEFMVGLDGPVIFTSLDGSGLCHLGFGALLGAGRTLEVEEMAWGEHHYPRGRVRIGPKALEFLDGR